MRFGDRGLCARQRLLELRLGVLRAEPEHGYHQADDDQWDDHQRQHQTPRAATAPFLRLGGGSRSGDRAVGSRSGGRDRSGDAWHSMKALRLAWPAAETSGLRLRLRLPRPQQVSQASW